MFEQADTGLHTWPQKVAAVCGAFTARFAHDPALSDQARQRSSITDIAFECGYQDAAHFSRVFRQRHQQSPRSYRNARSLEFARP